MYNRIIYCNCGGEIFSENLKNEVVAKLSSLNVEKLILNDLCGLCATQKNQVKELFSLNTKTLIIACHPRAIKLLLTYSGLNSIDHLSFLNLHDNNTAESLNASNFNSNENKDDQLIKEISSNPEWPAWYPVIDTNRCSACGQCADFCLFGVYEKLDGAVNVINPSACKNNCPACARICPQSAIVFPKYRLGGAISGSDSFDEIAEQKRQLTDMNQILGSDIYRALEERKAKRQSIIKNEALKKAIEERNSALKEKRT